MAENSENSGRKKKKVYLENADLVREIKLSVEKGRATEKLGSMLMLMAQEIGRPFPYSSDGLREDVYADAVEHAIKQYKKWDESVSSNAFSWYTSIIINKLRRALGKRKKIGIVNIPIDKLITD